MWENRSHEITKNSLFQPQQTKAQQNHVHILWDTHWEILTYIHLCVIIITWSNTTQNCIQDNGGKVNIDFTLDSHETSYSQWSGQKSLLGTILVDITWFIKTLKVWWAISPEFHADSTQYMSHFHAELTMTPAFPEHFVVWMLGCETFTLMFQMITLNFTMITWFEIQL